MKTLQYEYSHVSRDMYQAAKIAMSDTDTMTMKFDEKLRLESQFKKKMNVNQDDLILAQEQVVRGFFELIIDLKAHIVYLHDQIHLANIRHQELQDYARTNTEEILSAELNEINANYRELKDIQEGEMSRLIRRHDLSVDTTIKRAERIINAAESVAVDVNTNDIERVGKYFQ